MEFVNIYESLEVASQLEFKKISNEEALHIFRTDDRFHLLDGIDETSIPDFFTVDHYKIYLGDVLVGIIGYNNFYDSWKDMEDGQFYNMIKNGKGKKTIWVQMLEMNPDAAREVNRGPIILIKSIFDYLDVYCRNNGYKAIWCGAKNERIANLYKRAGFIPIAPKRANGEVMMAYMVK